MPTSEIIAPAAVVRDYLQEKSDMTQNIVHNDAMSVTQETPNLAAYVRQTMENKDLTAREVERASQKGGVKGITHSYVNKIKNGDAANPSPLLLQALAKGLGESEELIFSLVRGKDPNVKTISNERFSRIAENYGKLSKQEKKNIEPILEATESAIFSLANKGEAPVEKIESRAVSESPPDASYDGDFIKNLDRELENHNAKARSGRLDKRPLEIPMATKADVENLPSVRLEKGKIVPNKKKKPS